MAPSFDASAVPSEDDILSNLTEAVAADLIKEDEDSREELDLYQEEIDQVSRIYTTILKDKLFEFFADAVDLYDNDLAITDPEAILKEGYAKSTVVSEEESVDSYHQDNGHHSAVNDNTENVSSYGEKVDGSRYNLNIYSAAETKEPENINSNLNLNIAAATAADDDIDNAKSPSEYENSLGDLDVIKDEYYHVKAIHSTNITNDGEILSLPLFSSVYRVEQFNELNTLIDKVYQVEQSDEEEEHHKDSIGDSTATAPPEIVSNEPVRDSTATSNSTRNCIEQTSHFE